MQNYVCLYRSVDLDGHCSGAIVLKKHPNAKMIPINYGEKFNINEHINDSTKLYILDFSLPPEEMLAVQDRLGEGNVVWCDHHESAINNSEEHGYAHMCGSRNRQYAGCELTWTYLFPEDPMPLAVKMLGRYDVWDHANPNVLRFQYGMRNNVDTHPIKFRETWGKLLDHDAQEEERILSEGTLILGYETSQNSRVSKAVCYEADYEGYRFIVANRSHCNSNFFNGVYDERKHDAMALYTYNGKKGGWIVSLFSTKDDIDILSIALRNGGGGHLKACGFQTKTQPFSK